MLADDSGHDSRKSGQNNSEHSPWSTLGDMSVQKFLVPTLSYEASHYFDITAARAYLSTSHSYLHLHQSTAASTWWCGPRTRLGWIEMADRLPEGPSYPGHSPSFFRYATP